MFNPVAANRGQEAENILQLNPVSVSSSKGSETQSTLQTSVLTTNASPNPANSGKVENGCWYIDWTSWGTGGYPVPRGVNSVNIFVGNMSLDANGKPVIGGFGAMSEESMNAFIKACHAQGISVKLSLGGSTSGMYGRCWDVLTQGNVGTFAGALVDYCHAHGADGIDFDFEEFLSPDEHVETQVLVGKLIKEFKNRDPKLETSLCSNSGFGPNFPWQKIVKNVLDAASTTDPRTGKVNCAVDRMYIMSYYNSINEEEAWVSGWANWLETNYNFKPAQISVGLDDTDAHAYDIKAFAAWAASQGFSTCYWEWDPNNADRSNDSTDKIKEAYGSGVQFPNYWYAEFKMPIEEPKTVDYDLLPQSVHHNAV